MSKTALVDGFSLNSALRYLPGRFFPLALGQLDFLRVSTDFRARWYHIPEDHTVPIVAFDTLLYQVRVVPGSYLWGFNFAVLGGNVNEFYIQIGDDCNHTEFFSSAIMGTALRPTARLFPVLIEPRFIPAPGLLNVELTNRGGTDRQVQLVLHCSEPCELA